MLTFLIKKEFQIFHRPLHMHRRFLLHTMQDFLQQMSMDVCHPKLWSLCGAVSVLLVNYQSPNSILHAWISLINGLLKGLVLFLSQLCIVKHN
jgi:hypothetical protein